MKKKEAIVHFDELADFLSKSKIAVITSDDKKIDAEMLKAGIICGLSYAQIALGDDAKISQSVEETAIRMLEASFKALAKYEED